MTIKEYLSRAYGIRENISACQRAEDCTDMTYKAKICRMKEVQSEIERLISQVDNNIFQALLRDRYINFLPWERIAENINYESARWVRTVVHNKALAAAEKVWRGDAE